MPLTAWAGGYERPVQSTARYAGTAGAAVSSVKGPQALLYNPAALSSLQGMELTADGGAVFYKNEGPLVSSNTQLSSSSTAPQFSAFLGYALTPQVGIALGAYSSGQVRSVFENLDLRSVNAQFDVLRPVAQSSLDFTEIALGGGVAVNDNLDFGLSWRTMIVSGALSTLSYSPTQVTASQVDAIDVQDISATRASGFRLGARLHAEDYSWGLGLEWRTQVTFNASATANARTETSTAGSIPTDRGSSAVKVASVFPQQLVLGAHLDAIPRTLRLSAQWDWTNTSRNKSIGFTGTAGGATIPNIVQDWNNQQAFRLGAALQVAELWQLRGGYVFDSQVISDERANAALGAPGPSHTVTAGVGTWLSQAWSLDFGFDYTMASGSVEPSESLAGTTAGAPTYVGNYSTSSMSVIAGIGHRF